jgi:hypothetical protein
MQSEAQAGRGWIGRPGPVEPSIEPMAFEVRLTINYLL